MRHDRACTRRGSDALSLFILDDARRVALVDRRARGGPVLPPFAEVDAHGLRREVRGRGWPGVAIGAISTAARGTARRLAAAAARGLGSAAHGLLELGVARRLKEQPGAIYHASDADTGDERAKSRGRRRAQPAHQEVRRDARRCRGARQPPAPGEDRTLSPHPSRSAWSRGRARRGRETAIFYFWLPNARRRPRPS